MEDVQFIHTLKEEYIDIHESHGHQEENSSEGIPQVLQGEGISQSTERDGVSGSGDINQHLEIPSISEKSHDGEDQSDSGDEQYTDNQHLGREFLEDKEESLEDVTHDGEQNKVYVVASLEEDDVTSMMMNKSSDGEQPKRHLFGPPSWKPEQLQLAIEAVKKGYSITEAGKQYGIPRTTLSNKIYGRKRKRPKESGASVSKKDSWSYTAPSTINSLDSAHSLFIGYEQEYLLAKMISAHLHEQRYILTRCVLDLVKYFASSQRYNEYSDEYILEWIGYFFIRHRQARFEIITSSNNQNEEEEKKYCEFVFRRHGQNEKADNIRKSLFTYIGENKLKNGAKSDYIGMLWWYYFLKKYDSIKYFFINNLSCSESILDDTLLFGEDRRPIKCAFINMILNRAKPIEENFKSVRKQGVVYTPKNLVKPPTNFTQVRPSPEPSRPSQSPRPSEIRRHPEPRSHSEYHPRSQDESSNDDYQDHYNDNPTESPNITSSTANNSRQSFKETLALEGLRAVERKLSVEELKFFKFRFANPQLEEAYDVWKSLKAACSKTST